MCRNLPGSCTDFAPNVIFCFLVITSGKFLGNMCSILAKPKMCIWLGMDRTKTCFRFSIDCRGIKMLAMKTLLCLGSHWSASLKNLGVRSTFASPYPRAAVGQIPSSDGAGSVRASEAEIVVFLCCEQTRLTWWTPCCIYSVTQLPWSTESLFLSTEDFLSHNKLNNTYLLTYLLTYLFTNAYLLMLLLVQRKCWDWCSCYMQLC